MHMTNLGASASYTREAIETGVMRIWCGPTPAHPPLNEWASRWRCRSRNGKCLHRSGVCVWLFSFKVADIITQLRPLSFAITWITFRVALHKVLLHRDRNIHTHTNTLLCMLVKTFVHKWQARVTTPPQYFANTRIDRLSFFVSKSPHVHIESDYLT